MDGGSAQSCTSYNSDSGLNKIIFAGSGERSKLGADKRTSAFIFGNKSAASEIKKSAKKKQS